jgi:hypothetical protein
LAAAGTLAAFAPVEAVDRRVGRLIVALAALITAIMLPNAGAGAEDLPVYDPRVSAALDQLDAVPATNQLREVLATNQVDVRFVPMAAGVYARYSVARHVIEIDERWSDADTSTLAAVIAHEATHAQDAVSGYLATGGESACIDSEVRAFRTSALFWISKYGVEGKLDANSELDRQLNSIGERQLRDPSSLEALVRQTYSQQCSH